MNDSRFKIPHQLNLTLGVPRARGNNQRADFFRAVMETKATRKEAVSHHVLKNIAFAHTGHIHTACQKVCPNGDIMGGMKHYRGSPSST